MRFGLPGQNCSLKVTVQKMCPACAPLAAREREEPRLERFRWFFLISLSLSLELSILSGTEMHVNRRILKPGWLYSLPAVPLVRTVCSLAYTAGRVKAQLRVILE